MKLKSYIERIKPTKYIKIIEKKIYIFILLFYLYFSISPYIIDIYVYDKNIFVKALIVGLILSSIILLITEKIKNNYNIFSKLITWFLLITIIITISPTFIDTRPPLIFTYFVAPFITIPLLSLMLVIERLTIYILNMNKFIGIVFLVFFLIVLTYIIILINDYLKNVWIIPIPSNYFS